MKSKLACGAVAGLAVLLCARVAPAGPLPATDDFAPTPRIGQLEGFWLGLSLANWSGLCFFALLCAFLWLLVRSGRRG